MKARPIRRINSSECDFGRLWRSYIDAQQAYRAVPHHQWRGPSAVRVVLQLVTPSWLLIALMSLRVVHEQFQFLILMQMNREDLGLRYKELLLPIPRKQAKRDEWSSSIRKYFEATTIAR